MPAHFVSNANCYKQRSGVIVSDKVWYRQRLYVYLQLRIKKKFLVLMSFHDSITVKQEGVL